MTAWLPINVKIIQLKILQLHLLNIQAKNLVGGGKYKFMNIEISKTKIRTINLKTKRTRFQITMKKVKEWILCLLLPFDNWDSDWAFKHFDVCIGLPSVPIY